jgi:hypothetical protein
MARNIGFSAREIHMLEDKVREERERFIEAWHGYFNDRG